MKRRSFLRFAGALATVGWLGAADAPADPARSSDSAATAASDRRLSVERIETFDRVVRLNDLGDDPAGRITAFADLDERERSVFERAAAAGYETDDPPAWLVRFASGTPVVDRDGSYYRLDHTLPTTTVTAETASRSAVDGEIAGHEAYEAAVTRDGRAMTGLLRLARRGGVDLTYVWPELREFLATYDAVDYRGEVVAVSVAVDDPGSPYRIEATEVDAAEAVPGAVWDASAADPDARKLVRRAGRARGAYGFEDAPEGFLDTLDDHRYVYLDGTFYTAYVESRESVPVSLSASFADGAVALALRNDAGRELRVTGGAPRPFGVVRAHPIGDPDDRRILWSDAYEASDYVRTDGREVRSVADVALNSTVAPGGTLRETYAVDAADLPAGEYAVEGSVGVDGGDAANLRYRVVFSVA